jgi:hypothetical protein
MSAGERDDTGEERERGREGERERGRERGEYFHHLPSSLNHRIPQFVVNDTWLE